MKAKTTKITGILLTLVLLISMLSLLGMTAHAAEPVTLSGDTFTESPGEGFTLGTHAFCGVCDTHIYPDSAIEGHSFEITSFNYQIGGGTISYTYGYKIVACEGTSTGDYTYSKDFTCSKSYSNNGIWITPKGFTYANSVVVHWARAKSDHQGDATCVTAATCTLCAASYTNAGNHEKPAEFIYSLNASDNMKHDKKYACCGDVIETVAHTAEAKYTLNTADNTKHDKSYPCCDGVAETATHGGYSYTASDATITAECGDCKHTQAITLLAPSGFVYNGSEAKATVSGSVVGVDTPEIVYTSESGLVTGAPTIAGNYTASITAGEGEGSVTVKAPFTIEKATLTAADFTVVMPALAYDGTAKMPSVSYRNDIVEVLTLSVRYYDQNGEDVTYPTDAGTYTLKVSVAESENYKAVTDLELTDFTITRADLYGAEIIFSLGDRVAYNGKEQKPEVTVVVGGRTLVPDKDYTLEWRETEHIVVGEYPAYVTGIGNYSGRIFKNFRIAHRTLTEADVTVSPTYAVYDGNAHTPTYSVVADGITLKKGIDFTASWSKEGFVDAGVYQLRITGTGNYIGSVFAFVNIKKAEPIIELSSPITAVLPGNIIALNLTVTPAELTPTWTLTNATHVSGTTIKIDDGLVIGQDKVTVTVSVGDKNYLTREKTIELEVGMADFAGAISMLEDKVEAIKAQYDATDTELSYIKDDIQSLKNSENITADQISAINSQLASIAQTYATKAELTQAVAELEAEINTNGTSITNIAVKLESISHLLDTLDAEDRLTEIETYVTKLTNDILPGLSDLITRNEADILKNEIEIGNLDNALENLKYVISDVEAENASLARDINALNMALTSVSDHISELTLLVEDNKKDIESLESAVDDLDKLVDTKADADEIAKQIAKIESLLAELGSARYEYANADSILKAELEAEIEVAVNEAREALSENLDKIGADLDAAKKELNKALAEGDKKLDEKITALYDALVTAEAAYKAAHASLVSETGTKIADAKATMQVAVDKLASELSSTRAALEAADAALEAKTAELEAKDESLNGFITAVCVISCVSLAGSGAFAVWFFIDRRRRAL